MQMQQPKEVLTFSARSQGSAHNDSTSSPRAKGVQQPVQLSVVGTHQHTARASLPKPKAAEGSPAQPMKQLASQTNTCQPLQQPQDGAAESMQPRPGSTIASEQPSPVGMHMRGPGAIGTAQIALCKLPHESSPWPKAGNKGGKQPAPQQRSRLKQFLASLDHNLAPTPRYLNAVVPPTADVLCQHWPDSLCQKKWVMAMDKEEPEEGATTGYKGFSKRLDSKLYAPGLQGDSKHPAMSHLHLMMSCNQYVHLIGLTVDWWCCEFDHRQRRDGMIECKRAYRIPHEGCMQGPVAALHYCEWLWEAIQPGE